MAGIFISHSSKNSAEASQLRDWLETQGWGRSQVFLDLQDLKSGDSWRDVLNAMGDKEAVIVCLSNEWLGSHECVREFTQAQERGKPILPIFVAPVTVPIPRFITDLQIADATKDGFQSLRESLLAKRITPQSFIWPPKDEPGRSVYRGLQALDVKDAAIFFGRDADIARGLDALRQLRNGRPQRILVILGASGAGKSSFLRAGLIARLKRDEENFLVLPIIRPERAAISGAQGLAASVSKALGRNISLAGGAANLAQAFDDLRKPIVERLTRNAEAARETHAAKPPTIILPIDQAEELFGAENAERAAFCDTVATAITEDGNTVVVATIRSGSYEPLQTEKLMASAPQLLFNLPPIAAGSFQEIIEGPTRLAIPPLTIEAELTQQLLGDLSAADALPLLAFTLERLRRQFGRNGKLSLADYRDKLGGLSGAIQSAVNVVLGVEPSKEKLALARRLFVPALVQVDQDGVKRRVARREDIPAEVQKLADQFVDQRLLVADGGTIEVAHEAILRQWPVLAGWIADDREQLSMLESIRRAATDWSGQVDLHGKGHALAWLVHRRERLRQCETIVRQPSVSHTVSVEMRDYLKACRVAQRGAGRATVAAMLIFIVAMVVAGSVWNIQRSYHAQEIEAELNDTSDNLISNLGEGPDGVALQGIPFDSRYTRPAERRFFAVCRVGRRESEIRSASLFDVDLACRMPPTPQAAGPYIDLEPGPERDMVVVQRQYVEVPHIDGRLEVIVAITDPSCASRNWWARVLSCSFSDHSSVLVSGHA
jgi:hypothetical protein